jgi:hypothetical protein
VTYLTGGEVAKRVEAGETPDVVIATDAATATLTHQAHLLGSSRTIIAAVGVGVGAREARQAASAPPIGPKRRVGVRTVPEGNTAVHA